MNRKAVFLDRDGVINNNSIHYYIFRPEHWEFNSDIISALQILQNKGFDLFIFTNQGGISKGIYGLDEVNKLHRFVQSTLASHGIRIVDIAICPHHDEVENCLCRKPKSLLLERLIARYKIDPKRSFVLGDSERDILAANNLGIKSYRIMSNSSTLAICRDKIN